MKSSGKDYEEYDFSYAEIKMIGGELHKFTNKESDSLFGKEIYRLQKGYCTLMINRYNDTALTETYYYFHSQIISIYVKH